MLLVFVELVQRMSGMSPLRCWPTLAMRNDALARPYEFRAGEARTWEAFDAVSVAGTVYARLA
jgi:hypothetical protein